MDDAGDWVADLSCLHSQHVRHDPPIWPRPWTTTEAGRAGAIGNELDCASCDRAELPEGLVVDRVAGPFDERTLPAGLRRDHRIAEGVWGVLAVLEGAVGLEIATEPPMQVRLLAGDTQPIPPAVVHRLELDGSVRLEVQFLRR